MTWSETYLIFQKAEFVCPNIYRMFRSVDWTHDMIIVKWHLLIWHKRKLCALTIAPTVQSTQTGQWLSTLFHANYSAAQSMSCTLGNTSSLWAAGDDHFAGITIPLSAKKDILKVFVYLMMRNVMVKTCLNQKIIKNSNLIQAMKNSVCPKAKSYPKAEFFWKPNLSEYLPNVPKCG